MFESRRVHALLSTIYVLNWVARSAKLAKLSAGRFLAERISPLKSLKTGTVNDAKGAVSVFADLIQEDQDPLLSVGIDAPLFWQPEGGRAVDKRVRDRISG